MFPLFCLFILFISCSTNSALAENVADEFVVVLENEVERPFIESMNFIKKLNSPVASCESYMNYFPKNRFTDFIGHSKRVARTFQYSKIKVVLLQMLDPDKEFSTEQNLTRMADVFDCFSELAKLPGFRGVNISVSVNPALPGSFYVDPKRRDEIKASLSQKAQNFLAEHPNAFLTIALGNDHQRIENLHSSPQTDLCLDHAPPNVFCVTSFLLNQPYMRKGDLFYINEFKIDDLTYVSPVTHPDGTFENPYPIKYRYSNSENLIGVIGDDLTTSFLAPKLLKDLIEDKDLQFKENFLIVPDLSGTVLEKVQIRTHSID